MKLENLFDLKGHTALITGSSRGIGRAIAMALAEAGANVIIHGVHAGDNLQNAVQEAAAFNIQAFGVAGDISNQDGVRAMLDECRKLPVTPDILVLNASVQSYQKIEEFTAEECIRQYQTNLMANFSIIKEFIDEMKEKKWGRILAIGSVNQYKPSPLLPIYASSKAALTNLMVNCARQYSQFGITANNLAPGVITTDRNREALKDEAYKQKLINAIPAGHFGTPEDCAGLALLLCSNAGRYITGADIPVAGGMQL